MKTNCQEDWMSFLQGWLTFSRQGSSLTSVVVTCYLPPPGAHQWTASAAIVFGCSRFLSGEEQNLTGVR